MKLRNLVKLSVNLEEKVSLVGLESKELLPSNAPLIANEYGVSSLN